MPDEKEREQRRRETAEAAGRAEKARADAPSPSSSSDSRPAPDHAPAAGIAPAVRDTRRAGVADSRSPSGPYLHTTWESFRIAVASLRANKLRTGLTLIGIVVGVAAVIAVVTIIKGLDQTVASTFSSQGSTVFSVSKRPQIITSREDFIRFNRRKDMTEADAEAIFRLCSSCWRTGIAVNTSGLVKYGDQKSEGVPVRGMTLSMFPIDDTNVAEGRAWTEHEAAAGRHVCVVGGDIIDNLFEGAQPDQAIGKEVRINGQQFQVIGVAERLGKIFGASRDNFVLIPYPTYKKLYGSRESIIAFIQVPRAELIETAEDEVRSVMRNRRGRLDGDREDEGFTIETQGVFIDLYSKATSNIYIVTIGVAAISLVVGGIVVMNIMLVSVTERTKEIGIRKAVGASRRAVLAQFLIEALVLTGIGGALGVVFGFGLAAALALAMGFPLLFSVWSAVLGVLVSSTVGICSGIWPAWKAARLDPIEALRAE